MKIRHSMEIGKEKAMPEETENKKIPSCILRAVAKNAIVSGKQGNRDIVRHRPHGSFMDDRADCKFREILKRLGCRCLQQFRVNLFLEVKAKTDIKSRMLSSAQIIKQAIRHADGLQIHIIPPFIAFPESTPQSYLSSTTRFVFFSLRGRMPISTILTNGVNPILLLTAAAILFAISWKFTLPFVST